ncbi:MurT ligase domain-containing protein [Candidatus Saccharibacteria bacterium]|nr:MurT ligase domain-containing protein [Candidatus Saccharibacteria bacterium]
MHKVLGTLAGKTVKAGLKFRRGGGHALPGLVVESVFPKYLEKMIQQLPDGVVVITGTNGKTTTTKIVTQLLKANGKKVLTNSTGSNLTRGIVSSISQHATLGGKLREDIAVLEVDEATARQLVAQVKPRWVLGLNVSRDQLDRFGEIDTVAAYIGAAMQEATEGIITNARDPHLFKIANKLKNEKNIKLHYFGAAAKLAKYFPSDYELASVDDQKAQPIDVDDKDIDVQLADFDGQKVMYKINSQKYQAKLQLTGQHNFLNGAAAIALCRRLLPETKTEDLIKELSKVSLAFGRGEKYQLKNGAQIELVLVKNPASFTQALSSYSTKGTNLMIAINDNIADGRDVSWLWDVNFQPLAGQTVAITSGKRAVDMALRLSYDGTNTTTIEPSLTKAVKLLSETSGPKVILSTYTAMLQLYNLLTKQGKKL